MKIQTVPVLTLRIFIFMLGLCIIIVYRSSIIIYSLILIIK